jgi:hypothetical protein
MNISHTKLIEMAIISNDGQSRGEATVLSRAASNPANEICLGDVIREREGPEVAYGFAQKLWPNPGLHSDAAKSAAPVNLVR